jgi:hypothetical protein
METAVSIDQCASFVYDDFVKVIFWFTDKYIPKKSVIISHSVSRFISLLVQLLQRQRNRLMRTEVNFSWLINHPATLSTLLQRKNPSFCLLLIHIILKSCGQQLKAPVAVVKTIAFKILVLLLMILML